MREEEKILTPEFLEEIKRIREQRGISIEEVAEKTNIKPDYVRAIEDGDLARLPGGIYNRAFIRSYSEFLGISTKPYERKVESDEMIRERQVKVELGRPQNASMPTKLTIIGCLFVIFFLYSFFYGPRTTKKERVEQAIATYNEKQTEDADKQLQTVKTAEEKEIIKSELQARISDDASLIKKIDEVSPIRKDTQDAVNKELVITLMATDAVKVVVKDYYGKLLVNKEMSASEAIMLNGAEEYFMATSDIKKLEIYLDGVQIRDYSKIEKNGHTYIFKAENLVNVAESQPFEKTAKAAEPSAQAPAPAMAEATKPVQNATPTLDKSADKTQNNPQGSGR